MNENINLCQILKGHEGKIFYSPILGDLKLESISDNGLILCFKSESNPKTDRFLIGKSGKLVHGADEIAVYPSKDQRNWGKWDKEQKLKVPKTWSELVEKRCYIGMGVNIDYTTQNTKTMSECGDTPIEKSALALLKINQLIEVGYGGNVLCNKEKHWEGGINGYTISIKPSSKRYLDGYEIIPIERSNNIVSPIMFKTKEYAEEFIKYEENCSLLRIFNMVAYSRDIK